MVIKRVIRPSLLSLKIIHYLFLSKEGATIKDISNKLKADYKNVYDGVSMLASEGLILKQKIGNYNVCRLNFRHEGVPEYLREFNYFIRLKEFKRKHPAEHSIVGEALGKIVNGGLFKPVLPSAYPFFICLIFGSYAKGEENGGSDIDILFITPNKNGASIQKFLAEANAPYKRKFHIVVQDVKSFLADLVKKKELSIATELNKELPIVFYGADIFFRVVAGANQV
ncbi:nucleotidyltransferase domain-containing protein [Candidatus Woesearchaeota archaeon]|nr:nucleotidyltransferase domain-containing protein [Candidatus Woesearchaeota archaeon]